MTQKALGGPSSAVFHRAGINRAGDSACERDSIEQSIVSLGERLPSNLTDAQWAYLAPLIPPADPGGRPRKTDMRAAMNAIFYLLRLSVALSASRTLFAALNGLQYLPQVPARGSLGGDLG